MRGGISPWTPARNCKNEWPASSRNTSSGATRRGLVAIRLGSGNALLQELDLAVVVRFVLADMEPLAVIVCGAPSPSLVDREEPIVITFAEFGKRLFAGFFENVEVVVEIVAFDSLAGRLAEFH